MIGKKSGWLVRSSFLLIPTAVIPGLVGLFDLFIKTIRTTEVLN